MSIDLTKCRELASGNIATCKGRMSYAQYTIGGQLNKQGKMVWNGALLVPPNCDFTLLKNKMGVIALDKLDGDETRAKKMVEKRFLDPNDLPNGGKPAGPEFKGWTLIRCSSQQAPDFAGPDGKKIPPEQVAREAYSGRWASFSVNPYWSSNDENPGVFIGLQNVQLLDHDDNLGAVKARADDEFGAVEGVDTGEATQSEVQASNVDAMFG